MTYSIGFIDQHFIAKLLHEDFNVRIIISGTHSQPEVLVQQVEIVYGILVDKIKLNNKAVFINYLACMPK